MRQPNGSALLGAGHIRVKKRVSSVALHWECVDGRSQSNVLSPITGKGHVKYEV